MPEATEGMTGLGWEDKVFDWYTIDGAVALRDRLERFRHGRLLVQMTGMPRRGGIGGRGGPPPRAARRLPRGASFLPRR